jgi:hypothetical protein
VNIKEIDPGLLSEFEVKAPNQKTQRWFKALLDSRFGAVENCWTDIEKGGQQGLITCNVEQGAVSSHCTIMAKSFFLDTSSLPPAPKRPKF